MKVKDLSDGRIEYDSVEGRVIGRRVGSLAVRDAMRMCGPMRCSRCQNFYCRPKTLLAVVDRLDRLEPLTYVATKHAAFIFAQEFSERGMGADMLEWACVQHHQLAAGGKCQTFLGWAKVVNARVG